MTSWVRLRSSTTTSECVSPTFSSLALSAMSLLLSLLCLGPSALDDLLGADADAGGGDDQLVVRVVVLGDRLGEDQLPAPLALLLVGLAGPDHGVEHVAGPEVAVVLEVLLGVQATGRRAGALALLLLPLDAGGLAARAEPGLAGLGAQEVLVVELGRGLGERGGSDDVADLG